MKSRAAVFFDRDGVVNVPPPKEMRYLRRWEDFQFVAGMVEVLAAVKSRGFPMFLITNQQGVGKGLMTLEELEAVHESMQRVLGQRNAAFDGIYAATGLTGVDLRRKPSPSMLQEAATQHDLDLQRSWIVGDHDNDMRAGQAAGTKTIRVKGLKEIAVPSDYQVADASALAALLNDLL